MKQFFLLERVRGRWQGEKTHVYVRISATGKNQVCQMTSNKDWQTQETTESSIVFTRDKVSFFFVASNYSSPACGHGHRS